MFQFFSAFDIHFGIIDFAKVIFYFEISKLFYKKALSLHLEINNEDDDN